MLHHAGAPRSAETIRIVTVGMGKLGGMVARQLIRSLKDAECILLEDRDEIIHELSVLGQKVSGACCAFIVVDPLDREALNTANWLARRMMAERALVVILTSEPSGDYQHLGGLACSSIVVSPLSINPLSEDVLPMFGKEMLATYLIRHVIEMIIRLLSPDSIICIDFADIKAVMGGGGIMRLGIGMNTNGDAGDAVHKAIESLARQGVGLSPYRGMIGCVSGSTNLTMEDFEEVSAVLNESLDAGTSVVLGLHIDDKLGRTVKVTLLCG